jgi:trimeric autotransporter adhesin
MKHIYLLLTVLSFSFFLSGCHSKSKSPDVLTQVPVPVIPEGKESEGQDGIAESQKMEFEITRDVSLGYVPKYRLVEAMEKIKKDRLSENLFAEALTWTERGSNSDAVGPSNGNGRVSAGQVTSGRTRTVWVDLADVTNQTVWAGGIDGGIWKTTNIVADPSPWALVTDLSANIAVSSICQSPVNTDIMYFGTGEKTINGDAVRGGGVWKSIDHGVTWNLLTSTINFWNVSNVICDPTNPLIVYVATIGNGNGIQRSIDGGTTWTNITPAGLSTRVTRMEISSTGRMHIVCGYWSGAPGVPDPASGYRYTDIPSTVTSAAGWTTPVTSFYTSNEYNADIAVAGNTLYALPSTAAFQTPNVWKSTDGGANWVTTTAIPIVAPTPVSSGQAWYCLAIGVDPTNADNVMVGGLNSYISTDGGTSWSPNSVWVTGVPGSGNYIHADHHIIVWNNNQVLDAGDGGIFYSGNDGVTFSDRNVGLRLKQFYSVAVHPTSTNYFIGGTQDNGTHQLNAAGLTSSVEVMGGDGGFTHIDQDEPQFQFTATTFSSYFRSADGGATWSGVNFGGSGQFINPTDYDDVTNKLYTSWTAGNYFRWDDANSGTAAFAVPVAAFNSATVRHVKVSPHTANRVFFGTGGGGGGRIVRVDNAHLASATGTNITGSTMPAAPNSVSCVAVGTTDNHLLATFSNYSLSTNRIWVSTVGGGAAGWTNITGNLPDIPVRWAMFFPEDNTKALLGTDLGVWETTLINGAATTWVQDPTFPIVRVDMLQYRAADGLVVAATHGRGIWTAPIAFTTPYVRFAFPAASKQELTTTTTGCRSYTDYTVDMRIDIAPTGNANVTLSGSGAAVQGVDYDFTTNGNFAAPSSILTFANGSATPQPITIRIYNDAEVESAESFTLTYSIGGGTNAVAAPSSLSYVFTITDNDVVPTGGIVTATIGTGVTGLNIPFRSEFTDARTQILYTAAELTTAGFTAGNIYSMAFNVSSKTSTAPFNNFNIKIKNTPTTALQGGIFEGVTTPVFGPVNYSTVAGVNTFVLSSPFAWDGTSNLLIDICFDNSVAGPTPDLVAGTLGFARTQFDRVNGSAGCSLPNATFISGGGGSRINITFAFGSPVETVASISRTEHIGNNGTYFFYSTGNTNIINSLSGVTTSLGCVNASIFEAGTTWVNFQGGERSQKVFDITPTTNPGATYTVGLYFTNAELDGETPNGLRIAKTTAATMAAANSSNTVFATTANPVAFGSGWIYTATFTGFSKFFLVDLGAVLPVSLISFNGVLDNDKIPLSWVTSSEQNSMHFDIEKSSDGVNYYSIGIIPAAGNSSSDRNYGFTDDQVKEFNYYRLKMVDIDGRFVYSQIILIKNQDLLQGVQVVNNPFSSYIDVRFTKIPSQQVQLELLNIAGTKVYSRQYGAAGQIRFELSGVTISNGTYLLRVIADGKQYVNKVVKQ